MVLNGTVKKEDKIGNDKSDENADLGVISIHGVGLVKFAKWLAQRHDKYGKLMRRIRKFIAGMMLAEKDEREKEKAVNKSVLGYDPDTWIKTKAHIKYEDLVDDAYEKLKLPPVVKGKHKYAYCQDLYEDIHIFLQQRMWSHTRPETACSGITWTELFVLFDTAGYRSQDAVHVKDKEAVNRAAKRRRAAREAQAKKVGKELKPGKAGVCDITQNTVMSKPPPEQELALFKGMVRQIAQHELGEDQKKMFRMESRAKLRRLAPLGITGNQPAIAAFCKIDMMEKKTTIEAILQQKIGANPKTQKAHSEFKERIEKSKEEGTYQENGTDSTMLVKLARVANGTVVRWKRKMQDPKTDEARSEDKRSGPGDVELPRYSTRLLSCTRCEAQQETAAMQLRCAQGYRAIHCKRCGKQERTIKNRCQCGMVWHICPVHRVDPEEHRSRKGLSKTREEKEVQRRTEEEKRRRQ